MHWKQVCLDRDEGHSLVSSSEIQIHRHPWIRRQTHHEADHKARPFRESPSYLVARRRPVICQPAIALINPMVVKLCMTNIKNQLLNSNCNAMEEEPLGGWIQLLILIYLIILL